MKSLVALPAFRVVELLKRGEVTPLKLSMRWKRGSERWTAR